MFQRGYTLVEFLIVVGILSLSIGSVLLILTSVIKGANQANIIAEVKQNGQGVLDSLQSQIRGAGDVSALSVTLPGPSEAKSGLFVTAASGEKLTIICVEARGGDNGWIGVYKGAAGDSVPNTLVSNFQPITNTETISGVDIDCTPDPTDSTVPAFAVSSHGGLVKTVTIRFIANQGVSAPSRVDFKANAEFRTVLSLRIY